MSIDARDVGVIVFWVVAGLFATWFVGGIIRIQIVYNAKKRWTDAVFSPLSRDWWAALRELNSISDDEMVWKFWRRTSWFIRDKPLLKALMEKKNDPRS